MSIIAYSALQQLITSLQHNHYVALSQKMNAQVERMMDVKRKSVLGIALAFAKDKAVYDTLSSTLTNTPLNTEPQEFSKRLNQYTSFKNVWIQIIDAQGISRNRSWSNKFGDSLINTRSDVREIIANPRIIENISVGKFTMSFKSMVPVFNEQKFIGIVELITHFNSIILELEKENIQSMVIAEKHYKAQLTKSITNTFIDDYYISNFDINKPLLQLFRQTGITNLLKAKPYLLVKNNFITHTAIKDIEGHTIGYYFQIRPLADISSQAVTNLINKITIIGLFIFIVIFFSLYILYLKQKKTETQKDFFHAVLDSSNDGIIVTDFTHLIDINDAFIRHFSLSNLPANETINFHWLSEKINQSLSASYKKPNETWEDFFLQFHNTDVELTFTIHNKNITFSIHLTRLKETEHQYILRFIDITKQKAHTEQLEYIAHFDALTGLPNRVLLADRLAQAMKYTLRLQQKLAVVFLDLDGFKDINDTYGHDTGDKLLITLSTKMKTILREGDTIARLGGDEFVAVLVDVNNTDDCTLLLNRLLNACAQPIKINQKILKVSASIGSTFYPQKHDVDADQLLRQADQAMYHAKLSGKNRFHYFDIEKDLNIRSHFESLERLQQALDKEEFILFYQPKINMRTGAIVGAEALIRWQHPEQGIKAPESFLPTLENQKLSLDLGNWVIDRALAQINEWRKIGINIPISINISACQLHQPDFVTSLQQKLNHYPLINHSSIELEILETSALEDIYYVSKVIEQCKNIGIPFALDDFGTGYSSLTYLKTLPAKQLKIDHSFIKNMLKNPDDLAILESIVGLANAFHRNTLAEGIESIQQGKILLQLGCEIAQGYLIAKPMPAKQLPEWIKNWKPIQQWRNITPIDKEDFSVLYERIELNNWINDINHFILNKTQSAPKLSQDECRFGQWLKTKGKKRYSQTPSFKHMTDLHEQLHHAANNIISQQEQKILDQPQQQLKHINNLREQLLNYLDQLVSPKQ